MLILNSTYRGIVEVEMLILHSRYRGIVNIQGNYPQKCDHSALVEVEIDIFFDIDNAMDAKICPDIDIDYFIHETGQCLQFLQCFSMWLHFIFYIGCKCRMDRVEWSVVSVTMRSGQMDRQTQHQAGRQLTKEPSNLDKDVDKETFRQR